MKHTNLISFLAGAAICTTLGLGLGFTQPEKVKDKAKNKAKNKIAEVAQPETGEMPDMDAMFAMMAEKATPGDHHEELSKTVGHWTAAAEFMVPGMDPMTSTGTMHTEWVLGGRYTVSHFNLPEFMGQPFEGMAITGYSNYTNEYNSVWVDTMSTHMTTTTGKRDKDGVLAMTGTSVTPMGEAGMKIETTCTDTVIVDKFFDEMPDGSWVHSGTITYTRADGMGG